MSAEAAFGGVHPIRCPSQRTLRRRINNWSIYRTIMRAFRDCHAQEPILMAPCGYGWFFDRFQRDKMRIVGIDIDNQTVEYARTAITPAPRIIEGSLLEMPFQDGEFDFIVNNRFMPHFDADFRAKAFKELARVARRYVLVHYDHPISVRQILRRLRGARKPRREIEQVEGWRKTQIENRKELFNRAQMEKEGAAAGLRVKGLYFVTPLVSDRVYCLYEKM
jgi:SAM-dependent methyltransferase